MKRLLFVLVAFVFFILSCKEKHGIHYFFDEVSKDTFMSILLFPEPNSIYPTAHVVFRDSICERDTVKNLLARIKFEHLIEKGKNYRGCNLLFHIYNGSFSDYSLYNDSMFYAKSHISYLGEDSYLNTYVSPLLENEVFVQRRKREAYRKQAILDSIAEIKRDSFSKVLSQKEVELSFYEYKIGSLYSNLKKKRRKNLSFDEVYYGEKTDIEKLYGEKFQVKIFDYNDTIYKIVVNIMPWKPKSSITSVDKILNLYRDKYSDGIKGKSFYVEGNDEWWEYHKPMRKGEKWMFKNGEISIVTVTDVSDFRTYNMSITYLDYALHKKKEMREECKKREQRLKEEKEKKKNEKRLYDNI